MSPEDEKLANEVLQPQTGQESPQSVTIQFYYKGFSILLTKRDPEVLVKPLLTEAMKAVDWAIENNLQPSWNTETNKQHVTKTPTTSVDAKSVVTPVKKETPVCASCGSTATYQSGVSASGRKWRSLFCDTGNKSHTVWL